MSKSKTILIGIGIVIIILVALFVGSSSNSSTQYKKSSTSSSVTPNKKPTVPSSTQSTQDYPVYKPSTTVPSSWQIYSNTQYGFSLAHISDWSVNETSDKSATIYSSNDSISYFNATFKSPGANGPSSLYYSEAVTNQTLAQNISSDIQLFVNNNNFSGSTVSAQQTGTSYYMYNGTPAAKLTTQITNKTTGSITYTVDFIVSANGNAYDFSSQSTGSDPLTNQTILIALESFKLN